MSELSWSNPAVALERVNVLGAGLVSVLLHGLLGMALLWSWQPAPPPSAGPRVLQAQLHFPPPAPIAEPVAESPPPVPQPITPESEPALKEPTPDPADVARKQREQKQREQEQRAREKREAERRLAQQKEQKRREEAERQARIQQQIQQQQAAAREAEAARLAAERWAANNRQYAPLQKTTPGYPDRALSRGIEGDCTVEYTVTPDGRVANPQVVDSCHPLFIQPSLQAAQAFVYRPQLVDGQPQAVSGVRNTFHYRIQAAQ